MSQRHSTLPEVVSTILPLIDSFPELRWSGLFTTEDFVEHWFPFIADLVQNGVYAPPVTNSADGNQQRRPSGSNGIVGGLGGRRRSSRGTTAVKALVSLMRRTSAVPGDSGTAAANRGKRGKGAAHAAALKAQSELMPSVVEAVRTFVSTCPVEVRHIRLQDVELGVLQRRILNDIASRQIVTNSRSRRWAKTLPKSGTSSGVAVAAIPSDDDPPPPPPAGGG